MRQCWTKLGQSAAPTRSRAWTIGRLLAGRRIPVAAPSSLAVTMFDPASSSACWYPRRRTVRDLRSMRRFADVSQTSMRRVMRADVGRLRRRPVGRRAFGSSCALAIARRPSDRALRPHGASTRRALGPAGDPERRRGLRTSARLEPWNTACASARPVAIETICCRPIRARDMRACQCYRWRSGVPSVIDEYLAHGAASPRLLPNIARVQWPGRGRPSSLQPARGWRAPGTRRSRPRRSPSSRTRSRRRRDRSPCG